MTNFPTIKTAVIEARDESRRCGKQQGHEGTMSSEPLRYPGQGTQQQEAGDEKEWSKHWFQYIYTQPQLTVLRMVGL